MRPTRFYIGFPPALVKRTSKKGIEYGIGAIPLGGYVKIPGMHRMSASDVDAHLGPALEEAPQLVRPGGAAQAGARREPRAGGTAGGGGAAGRGRPLVRLARCASRCRARRPRGARGAQQGGVLATADVETRLRHLRRAWNESLFAIILFAALFMAGGGKATATVGSVVSGEPAMRAGLKPGDKIYAINGVIVNRPQDIPDRISGVGRKEGAAAERPEGWQADPGAQARARAQARRAATASASASRGEGLSAPAAFWSSIKLTGEVTKQIGVSLGNLVHGEGRKDISSPVGIVQGSSSALKRGRAELPLGARADQPLARAPQPAAAAAARRRPHRLLDRGGDPRPRRRARDLRARLRRRDLPRRAASS